MSAFAALRWVRRFVWCDARVPSFVSLCDSHFSSQKLTDAAAARGLALCSRSGAITHVENYRELKMEKIRGTSDRAYYYGKRMTMLRVLLDGEHIKGRPNTAPHSSLDGEYRVAGHLGASCVLGSLFSLCLGIFYV